MCGSDPNCNCPKIGRKLAIHFEATTYRRDKIDGEDYYVVPVVMARDDVVMNEAVFPEEEWLDIAWNGVPVTIRHPETADGGFMSANSRAAREKYWVGTLFEVHVEAGKLKGEAWLSAKALNAKAPMVIDALNKGQPIDVSTGYFADVVPEQGTMNGRAYTARHTHVVPDHLALLPDQDGACSWADGCGVRANKRSIGMNIKAALASFANAIKLAKVKNADGTEPTPADPKQVIDVLISMEGAWFTEADRKALECLSMEALQSLAAKVANEVPVQDPAEKKEPEGMPKEPAGNKKDSEHAGLTNADKEALEHARRVANAHKASLVEKIVANSTISKAAAEAMDIATLETVANGITPLPVDFSGRPVQAPELVAQHEQEVANSMLNTGVVELIRNTNKKG